MELKIGNNIISSYKRLSYTAWYAFGEFVDNSTQAYRDSRKIMDRALAKEGKRLTVRIENYPNDDYIRVSDNSIGMSYSELEKALIIGKPPKNRSGRSRYGMGLKTAACWMGDKWVIKTSKLGEKGGHQVEVNVKEIIQTGSTKLKYKAIEAEESDHFTIIEISKLNRKFKGNTIRKTKDFLKSMYRMDFKSYGLQLFWHEELLSWNDLKKGLFKTLDGEPYIKEFEFEINEKLVQGWVGVLGSGLSGRKNAGFSIIQSDRVIEGWPDSYRPETIFGDQEGGRNDLVNQRLVGELILEKFEVSHTKDKIVWLDDEQEDIEKKLEEVSRDAIYLSKNARFDEDKKKKGVELVGDAVEEVNKEISSDEMTRIVETIEPPSYKRIVDSNSKIVIRTKKNQEPDYELYIGEGTNRIMVLLYFTKNSEYDPYVIIQTTKKENKVIVIINSLHPHFTEMSSRETVINFIRHCVYDGVSEWKAIKIERELEPSTIKFIKDNLLRLEYKVGR